MSAIYGLIDPRDGSLRYVGKANDAAKRYASHMRDSISRKTPVYAWIRKLAGLGLAPDMLVLSECQDWQREERRLIASARARGYALLNVAEGGEQPHCPTETRAANGRKNSLAREADPVKKTIHRYLQRMGHVFRSMEGTSAPDRVEERRAILAKSKAMAAKDPQSFYERIVSNGFKSK